MPFSFPDYIKSYFIELWNVCRKIILSILGIVKGNEYGEAAKEKITTIGCIVLVSALCLGVLFLFLSFFSGANIGGFYDSRKGIRYPDWFLPDFLDGGIGQFLLAILVLSLITMGVFDCLYINIQYDISFGAAILLSIVFILMRLFLGVLFVLLCAILFIFFVATVIFLPVFVICFIFSPIYYMIEERSFRICVSKNLCGNIYCFNLIAAGIIIVLPAITLYIIVNILPIFMYLSVK